MRFWHSKPLQPVRGCGREGGQGGQAHRIGRQRLHPSLANLEPCTQYPRSSCPTTTCTALTTPSTANPAVTRCIALSSDALLKTLNPAPRTVCSKPSTLHLTRCAQNPQPCTSHGVHSCAMVPNINHPPVIRCMELSSLTRLYPKPCTLCPDTVNPPVIRCVALSSLRASPSKVRSSLS